MSVEVLDLLAMPLRVGDQARMCPVLLVPHAPGARKRGDRAWLLVRFRASANATPRTYRCALTVTAQRRPSRRVTFRVTVADFRLDRADRWKRGCFTAGVQSDAKLRLMRAYGLNNLSIWHWHPSVYFGTRDYEHRLDRLDRYLTRLAAHGFVGPVPIFLQTSFDRSIERAFGVRYPSVEFRHRYVTVLRGLLARARRSGRAQVVLVLHDEPGAEPGKLNRWKTESAWVREDLPKARLYGVFYRRSDLQHLPGLCDIWCTNFGGFGPRARRIPGPLITEQARRRRAELWVYASAVLRKPPVICRYNAGLLPWQWEARRSFLWGDFETVSDLDDFDATPIPGHTLVFRTPAGLVPTLAYEAVRQGTVDLRYLVTLQKAVDRAFRQTPPCPDVERVQAYVRSLRTRLRGWGRNDRRIRQNRHVFGRIRRDVRMWLGRLDQRDAVSDKAVLPRCR